MKVEFHLIGYDLDNGIRTDLSLETEGVPEDAQGIVEFVENSADELEGSWEIVEGVLTWETEELMYRIEAVEA